VEQLPRDTAEEMLGEIGDIFDMTMSGTITDPNHVKQFILIRMYRRRALKFAAQTLSTFTHQLTPCELADVIINSFAKSGLAV
jgi:hypothetical protein